MPKPFCATGPTDLVKLEGPLDFAMTVTTDRSGGYERRYVIGGTLTVTPLQVTSTGIVPSGDPVTGLIFEQHRGTLDDHRGQVTEQGAQILLDDPRQSLRWRFAAGVADRFARDIVCGP